MTELMHDAAVRGLDALAERLDGDSCSRATTAGTRRARLEPRRRPAAGGGRARGVRGRRRRDRRAARAAGLRVAPQGTGHGAGSLASSPTRSCCARRACAASRRPVTLAARASRRASSGSRSPTRRRARPRRARRLLPRRRRSRLRARRRHQLARPQARPRREHVLAAEIVDADGVASARVDWQNDPELFWALRGGGGSFADRRPRVELRLFPIAEVYAGVALLPARARARGARGLARVDGDRPRRG